MPTLRSLGRRPDPTEVAAQLEAEAAAARQRTAEQEQAAKSALAAAAEARTAALAAEGAVAKTLADAEAELRAAQTRMLSAIRDGNAVVAMIEAGRAHAAGTVIAAARSEQQRVARSRAGTR